MIIHLASETSVTYGIKIAQISFKTNTLGTLNILERFKKKIYNLYFYLQVEFILLMI